MDGVLSAAGIDMDDEDDSCINCAGDDTDCTDVEPLK